jgi:hypothetical protein
MPYDMSHPLLVPETYGRVQFPRLVRQQSTRLEFVIATYDGLFKEPRVQIYSTSFYHLGLDRGVDDLIVLPQYTGRVDTRLPRSQEVVPFLSSPSHTHRSSIQPFVPTGANMVAHQLRFQ